MRYTHVNEGGEPRTGLFLELAAKDRLGFFPLGVILPVAIERP